MCTRCPSKVLFCRTLLKSLPVPHCSLYSLYPPLLNPSPSLPPLSPQPLPQSPHSTTPLPQWRRLLSFPHSIPVGAALMGSQPQFCPPANLQLLFPFLSFFFFLNKVIFIPVQYTSSVFKNNGIFSLATWMILEEIT